MATILHHFAYSIRPNKLELVLELFEIFGCTLAYRKNDERWCLVEQKPVLIDIQIIETENNQIPLNTKINTHIAFLSDSPKDDIDKVEQWSRSKNIEFQRGGWSDKELWFDLPDVFTNFVVEVMHTAIVE